MSANVNNWQSKGINKMSADLFAQNASFAGGLYNSYYFYYFSGDNS